VNVAVEKITSFLTIEDVSNLKENASLMTKFLTKEDVSENPSIVTKEDAPTEKKMNKKQEDDVPTLKRSDTDPVLTAVTVVELRGVESSL
jgi:hypothetical protein